MAAYDITLHGCDDHLTVANVELSPEELNAVNRVAALTDHLSDHGCQPYMTVNKHKEEISTDD